MRGIIGGGFRRQQRRPFRRLEKESLPQVGEVSDARYLGLLELLDFDQRRSKPPPLQSPGRSW
jgi:hypothetical protein